MSDTTAAVGRPVPRREGGDKVTGRARYTDDLVVPGAWYGKTVRSSIPRGRVRSITFDPAFDGSRVVVVTAADIPGENVVHLIRDDQPALAARDIRHREEPILLIAAPDRDTLAAAQRASGRRSPSEGRQTREATSTPPGPAPTPWSRGRSGWTPRRSPISSRREPSP